MERQAQIKPMVVVMPYCHVPREIETAPNGPVTSAANGAGRIERELLTGVKPLVESKYRRGAARFTICVRALRWRRMQLALKLYF